MKQLFLSFLVFMVACSTPVKVPPPPAVSPAWDLQVTVRDVNTGAPVTTAVGTLQLALQQNNPVLGDDANIGGRLVFHIPAGVPDNGQGILTIDAQGYQQLVWTALVVPNENQPDLPLVPLPPPLPAPPTREEALLMKLTFQGLTCPTDQFGDLNWFEPAIAWLTPSDRQKIYACKKAAGDTHLILGFPGGLPLYNECCNDFSPDRFGPLTWTGDQFVDLVVEVRQAGLIPLFFSDDTSEAISLGVMTKVLNILQNSKYGDITNQIGFYNAGWDATFYGWPDPHQVQDWATQVRKICPDCRLGIEFNPGHIPLGSGPADYTVAGGTNGSMSGFDIILGEVDGWITNGTPPGGGVWQVLKRMLGPAYVDDPGTDPGDAPWPFYLAPGSPRGPYQFCVFEYDEYSWVRHKTSAANINAERAYLKARGVKCTG
jgi:hypothetical protein